MVGYDRGKMLWWIGPNRIRVKVYHQCQMPLRIEVANQPSLVRASDHKTAFFNLTNVLFHKVFFFKKTSKVNVNRNTICLKFVTCGN